MQRDLRMRSFNLPGKEVNRVATRIEKLNSRIFQDSFRLFSRTV